MSARPFAMHVCLRAFERTYRSISARARRVCSTPTGTVVISAQVFHGDGCGNFPGTDALGTVAHCCHALALCHRSRKSINDPHSGALSTEGGHLRLPAWLASRAVNARTSKANRQYSQLSLCLTTMTA